MNNTNAAMKEFKRQFSLKMPCSECPFRKDRKGISGLQNGRLSSVVNDLADGSAGTFHCHKTLDGKVSERKHCAGAMAASLANGDTPQIVAAGLIYNFIDGEHYNDAIPLSLTAKEVLEQNL